MATNDPNEQLSNLGKTIYKNLTTYELEILEWYRFNRVFT